MSSSRRRPELRLSISQGRDGSQYHRGGTPEKSPSSGKYFLLTSPFIEQIISPTKSTSCQGEAGASNVSRETFPAQLYAQPSPTRIFPEFGKSRTPLAKTAIAAS